MSRTRGEGSASRSASVRTGLERLVEAEPGRLAGRRIGLLCNQASVDRALRHAVARLRAVKGCQLVRLFGPEHGLHGAAQDMIPVAEDRDGPLPVVSLYGASRATLRPSRDAVADLDLLVCDLQDVGSRYYTFVWTIVLCLEACAEANVPVLVCDRPNPITGHHVEGGTIHPGFTSFVGLHPVPNRHGLTVGELVRLAHRELGLTCALSVVPLEGWSRRVWFEDTGLPWVLPSPNMPTVDTALVYPGMCLVEATTLSEGRGTTRPFELVGAPFIDADRLAAALAEHGLPGVTFRPAWFTPQFQKFAGMLCGGVQLHVTDRERFRPYRSGIAVLATVHRLYPCAFAWREKPYEFVENVPAIDLLTGDARVREGIEAGVELDALCVEDPSERRTYEARRRAVLLYD